MLLQVVLYPPLEHGTSYDHCYDSLMYLKWLFYFNIYQVYVVSAVEYQYT